MDNENIENLNEAPTLSDLAQPKEVVVQKKSHTLLFGTIILVVVLAAISYAFLK
jgi:hypothetical protein